MNESTSQPQPITRFQWLCLGLAVTFAAVLLWQIRSLKQNVTESLNKARETTQKANDTLATVNEQLPSILGEVRKGTETLSGLAEDVELIKSVAGLENTESNRGLREIANYADTLQRALRESTEGKNATIMIEEIIGSDLKDVESAEEFLVGLNKEMVTLILPLAKSKQEVLYRATFSGPPRRKPFFIRIGEEEPVRLDAFIKEHHPPSSELPEYTP